MFGRGSPRMNLIQAAAMQRVSPRSTTNKRKKRTSPKGNIAEGTMNFTSIEPYRPPVTQPCQGAATHPSQAAFMLTQPSQPSFTQPSQPAFTQPSRIAYTQPSQAAFAQPSQAAFAQPSQAAFTQPSQAAFAHPSQATITQAISNEDDDLRVLDPIAPTSVSKRAKNVGAGSSRTRIDKRGQDGKVVEMMERFLEMKEKQDEVEKRATTNANEDDFPITTCIAIVDGMEELSDDEKVDAYDVFKDAQNRAIFMIAKDATRIKWLRKKIART
ncbi:OSJNBa0089K21.9-like protein [Zea mays]|uniref:OSJNBa0089K21.9-like protein n=1 Tax=Zea mays TaxID=4577 RepID=A0A1D6E5V9_MAIZE|nr:OSJNBa0089K21.9-like protein [Zea mays]